MTDGAALDAWFAEPLDGLHDPALLPDIEVLARRGCALRARPRRARPRVRRLRRGRPDRAGDHGPSRLRRFGVAVEPYVPSRLDEGHGLSIAALDAARPSGRRSSSRSTAARRAGAEIAAAGRARASTSSSRTTTASRRCCPRPSRSSTRTGRLALSRPPAGRERRRLQDRPAAPGGPARWTGGGPRRSPTSRRSGPSRTWRRSSARTGRSPGSGWRACAPRRARGSPRSWSGPGSNRRRSTSRPSRSPSRRGSTPPGGSARPSRPPGSCSPTTAEDASRHADALEAANLDAPRPA